MRNPVFVFKTSVLTRSEILELKPKLDSIIQDGDRWNFDLDDCDNILRVESLVCNAKQIKETLQIAGYVCEELH